MTIDPKHEKALLLIRKTGSASSLSPGQLGPLLSQLGWKVTKHSVQVPQEAEGMRGDALGEGVYSKQLWREESQGRVFTHKQAHLAALESARARLAEQVRPLPAKPKKGERYVLEVGAVQTDGLRRGFQEWFFTYSVVQVMDAFLVEAPNGATLDIRPESGSRRATLYDFWRWAKEQGIVAAIEARLGLPTLEQEKQLQAKPRDLENTGTCPACFINHKLTPAGGMWLHGYERPGDGMIRGECFGRDFPPYELSPFGTARALLATERGLRDLARSLAQARQGKVEKLFDKNDGPHGRMVQRGEERFAALLRAHLLNLESSIRYQRREVAELVVKVKDWKLDLLPADKLRALQQSLAARKSISAQSA